MSARPFSSHILKLSGIVLSLIAIALTGLAISPAGFSWEEQIPLVGSFRPPISPDRFREALDSGGENVIPYQAPPPDPRQTGAIVEDQKIDPPELQAAAAS